MARTVVILGASYAGLTIAHKLLKHTKQGVTDLEVVLISPSTHFYWNIASIRAIIPGQLDDSAIFQEIANGFNGYAGEGFEFVLGTADGIDVDNRTVSIATATGSQRMQRYDILVLATGSKPVGSVPWKATGSYETTRHILQETREKVAEASSIIIAGGGATGVELAGELGYEYGKKKSITLICGQDVVMKGSLPISILKDAEKELQRLHVRIIHNSKATTSTTPSGHTEIALSNGVRLVADLFLPTYGQLPNTQFLPKSLLNSKAEVTVDEFLRVKSAPDIWAAGDIVDIQRSGYQITLAQAAHVAKNLDLVLKKKKPVAYKVPTRDTVVVCLGRAKGTGAIGSFRIPSLAVWVAKGRSLGIERMRGLISGSGL